MWSRKRGKPLKSRSQETGAELGQTFTRPEALSDFVGTWLYVGHRWHSSTEETGLQQAGRQQPEQQPECRLNVRLRNVD